MMMKFLICLFLSLLLVVSVVEGLGGQKPIKVTDPKVVLIAKFAISEHNKKTKAKLVYQKIVQGTEQVVSGKKYNLTIAAKNGKGGATKNYNAVVLQKLWTQPPMILESFKEV